jgi:peptidoglycan/xylan/chitin deacetylase (PgdA/CDA1 family)
MFKKQDRNKIIFFSATFLVMMAIIIIIKLSFNGPSARTILLSFDVELVDGKESVNSVIEALKIEGINATFFVTGEYAERYPSVVRNMQGFEVGCHAWSHRPLTSMDDDDKKDEILRCREALEILTGEEITGFRAPYNRIDSNTLDILEHEGFTYDASMINGLGLLFPDVDDRNIGEIPISSVLGVPLEDVVWLHYLHLDGAYFYILKHKSTELESYLFHPHHIASHEPQLKEFIKHLKQQNVTFISHSGLTFHHEGV